MLQTLSGWLHQMHRGVDSIKPTIWLALTAIGLSKRLRYVYNPAFLSSAPVLPYINIIFSVCSLFIDYRPLIHHVSHFSKHDSHYITWFVIVIQDSLGFAQVGIFYNYLKCYRMNNSPGRAEKNSGSVGCVSDGFCTLQQHQWQLHQTLPEFCMSNYCSLRSSEGQAGPL